jgi:hypothetical protein
MSDSHSKSRKETPLKLRHEKSKKKLRKTPKKGKPGRTQTSLEEPRRIIYTYPESSYKVISSHKISP